MASTPRKPDDQAVAETEGGGDEAFYRRWSRRKHQARAQEVAAVEQTQKQQPVAEPELVQAPARILTDADMPPLESLNENSDFSMFASPGVSEELRRQAMRKLFLLPSINQRCPLDGEWYDCHGYQPLGDIITYDMREEWAREAEKLKDAALNTLRDDKTEPHAEGAATSAQSEAAASRPLSTEAATLADSASASLESSQPLENPLDSEHSVQKETKS
jgi:Protein of unknown function (DUF3306)